MIATANGLLSLSIPVEGGRNQRALYRDVRIDYRGDWQVRHWRSIFSAYGKSPWFFQYADSVEEIYRHRDPFLVDWNFRCLEWVCSALRLPADGALAMACRNREGLPANMLVGTQQEVASGVPASPGIRVSAPSVSDYPVHDIQDRLTPARFQDSQFGPFPRYPQVFEDRWGFQPNLGVLDLLFCCGPGAMEILQAMDCGAGY